MPAEFSGGTERQPPRRFLLRPVKAYLTIYSLKLALKRTYSNNRMLKKVLRNVMTKRGSMLTCCVLWQDQQYRSSSSCIHCHSSPAAAANQFTVKCCTNCVS